MACVSLSTTEGNTYVLRYVLKKALSWLLMIVVATNITFFLASFFLDPTSNYAERRPPLSHEQIVTALDQYNLNPDKSVFVRWWNWLTDIVLHWDWGKSPVGADVNSEIGYRAMISAQLVLGATILSAVIGIGLAVYTASRQYKLSDRSLQGLSILTLNIPIPVAALFVVFLGIWFNTKVGHTVFYVAGANDPNVSGFWDTAISRVQHLILPTAALTLTGYSTYHLTQRTLLLDNINADYVRTARAKGLTRQQAIRRHGLRTSLIPTATSLAFSIPALFTGAVLTETIFAWQGMGQYFIQALAKNDVHGTVAVAAFGAVMTALGAILADIAIVALDPRVRVN